MSYFNSNNGLETAMSRVVEQVLGKVLRYGLTRIISKVERQRTDPIRSLAGTIVLAVLSNTEFIVRIEAIMGKLVDGAVDELCFLKGPVASTAFAGTDPFIKCTPTTMRKPSKLRSDSELPGEPHRRKCHGHSSSCSDWSKNQYQKDFVQYMTLSLKKSPECGSSPTTESIKLRRQKVTSCQKSLQMSSNRSAHTTVRPCITAFITYRIVPSITMTMSQDE